MYQINNKPSLRSVLLLGAASAAAIAFSAPASAQENTGQETVVVTGSRIPQTGLYSSSPVSVIGQQDFKDTGSTNTEQILRQLPLTVGDGDNSTSNNGSAGISTVDLRGLGPNRTLVLVDSKRLQPNSSNGVVDLAQIPASMIDHVEVLTGGASSSYGGDAVSGVVNIILRKDFEGVQFGDQYGETNYRDGGTNDLNLVMGINSADGKGNVTLYGEYYNQEPITNADRPFGAHVLSSPNGTGGCPPTTPAGAFCTFGSSRIPQGRLTDLGLIFTGPYDGTTPAGNLVPYNNQSFSFAPDEFLQAQHTRYALGATGHYEVNKALDFYTRVMFSDNDNHNSLAPIAFADAITVNCGNPYMTTQERSVLFPTTGGTVAGCAAVGGIDSTVTHNYAARFLAAGNRVTDIRNEQYQLLTGARGDLGGGWSYDASASFGQAIQQAAETGDANETNFDATLLSDAIGTCSNGDPACYPSDIFHQQPAISPLAAAYFKAANLASSVENEWDGQINVNGDLGEWGLRSPWAKSSVKVAGGLEYRQEQYSNAVAGPTATLGSSAGYGFIPTVHGSYNTNEAYTEVVVPVIENMPFAESLEFDGGYRYTDYNLSGPAQSWKAAVKWTPVDDVTFRGSINRAVREPHISELFTPPEQSASNGYDPCGLATPGELQASLALCEATGVTAGQYKSSGLDCFGQCNSLIESNAHLNPEIGYTRSLGIVFTPSFFDGFTATIDYYNIDISGAIAQLPFQTVLSGCYDPAINKTQSPTAADCLLIHRDQFGSFNSSQGYAALATANIDSDKAKGFDFEAHYNRDLDTFGMAGDGSFGVDFHGTLATSASFTAGGVVDQCAGHYDANFCDVPNPRWRHNLRLSWTSPNADLSFYGTWRYLTSTTDEGRLVTDPIDAHAPSASYFDVGGSWAISDHVSLYGGAENVLNKKPPLFDDQIFNPATENANTFPGVYDALGISFFAGANVKF